MPLAMLLARPAPWLSSTRTERTLVSHPRPATTRSEEHTSELQSRFDLVCRLLLEKKKQQTRSIVSTLPLLLAARDLNRRPDREIRADAHAVRAKQAVATNEAVRAEVRHQSSRVRY